MPADTLRDKLQASLGTTYTIERELGGGGMSQYFRTRPRRKQVLRFAQDDKDGPCLIDMLTRSANRSFMSSASGPIGCVLHAGGCSICVNQPIRGGGKTLPQERARLTLRR